MTDRKYAYLNLCFSQPLLSYILIAVDWKGHREGDPQLNRERGTLTTQS